MHFAPYSVVLAFVAIDTISAAPMHAPMRPPMKGQTITYSTDYWANVDKDIGARDARPFLAPLVQPVVHAKPAPYPRPTFGRGSVDPSVPGKPDGLPFLQSRSAVDPKSEPDEDFTDCNLKCGSDTPKKKAGTDTTESKDCGCGHRPRPAATKKPKKDDSKSCENPSDRPRDKSTGGKPLRKPMSDDELRTKHITEFLRSHQGELINQLRHMDAIREQRRKEMEEEIKLCRHRGKGCERLQRLLMSTLP